MQNTRTDIGRLAVIALAAILLLLSGQGIPVLEAAPVRVTYGLSAEPVKLDPQDALDRPSFDLVSNIYDGLAEFDEQGRIVPALAERWTASKDGRTWTFFLRKGVRFHDGTEFTAEAVKFTIDRVLRKENALAARGRWTPYVKSVNILDRYRVQIVTPEPTSGFLAVIASPYGRFPSPAALKRLGKQFARNPVGTGPFMFVSWTSGQRIVLKKNPRYFRGAPKIDELIYRIVPEDTARVLALESGDVDMIPNVPAADLAGLEQSGKFQIIRKPTYRVFYWAFNNSKPYFKDRRVRQAFNYAINREAIIRGVLLGNGRPADSPLSPASPGYVSVKKYTYDPERAKQLLKEANFDTSRTLVALVTEGRYYQDRQVAEAVQGMLRQVGIQVEVKVMEWGTFVDAVWFATKDDKITQERDFAQTAWGDPDPGWALRAVLHSKSWPKNAYNEALYANTEIDRLIERIQIATTPDQEALRAVQERIMDEAPWILLHFEQQVYAAKKGLRGVAVLPNEMVLFRSATVQ